MSAPISTITGFAFFACLIALGFVGAQAAGRSIASDTGVPGDASSEGE
jgi:hypothetical protein